MARPYLSARTVVALVLLVVVAALCLRLGYWQLDRAAERDAISQAIERGRQSTPLSLVPGTPGEQLQDWRTAQAQGIWLHRFTVLLDNRNFNGRPGFWVATPLLIDKESNTALLVLRGWLARPVGMGQSLPDLTPPEGIQKISGQIRQHVPRLFELWSFSGRDPNALPPAFPAADGTPPRVQNLGLEDYAAATGLKLMPVVLEQTSDAAVEQHAGLVRDWPLPPTDSDTNRGYALQWFSFAAIAIIACVLIAWRTLRKRAAKPGQPNP